MRSTAELRQGAMPAYPFTAIVDQERVKTALILNAVDPTIGGVLISGPKGSGKSLIVRAFSQILPDIEQVVDCPFHCSPTDPTNMCPDCLNRLEAGEELPVTRVPMRMVQAPLSVTDDMLVGSIDLDMAVEKGVKALQPGLLAEANQNILYIDEVNLLPDHITDSILDAAASGWNTVEREGISVQHPSRFILVGTMNPEEGDLRPQILDRFGVFAETRNVEDPDLRFLVLRSSEEFAEDPHRFISEHRGRVKELRSRIRAARSLLPRVEVPTEIYSMVAETCSRLRVDGFRPDIVGVRVAKALAVLRGREIVSEEDIAFSVELALGHRTRRSGLAPPPSPIEIRRALRRAKSPLKLRFGGAVPKLRGVLAIPGELADRLLRAALWRLVVGAVVFGLLVVSVTYLIETLRITVSAGPPTLPTLLIEALMGLALSYLLSRILRRDRKEELAVGFVDLSKMSIEAEGGLQSPDRATGLGGGAAPAEVRYKEKSLLTPDSGSKILSSIEGLQRRPGVVGVRRQEKALGGGGYSGGRRAKATSSTSRGRYAWYQTPRGKPRDVALVPTLRAAALHQPERRERGSRTVIKPEDIRVKVREYHAPFSIILLVDMSLSMIESVGNIVETIYTFHRDVYRRRDRVGLIVFKGSKAFTVQHPTKNLDLVVEKLRKVGASDFTPMPAGLLEAWKALKQERLRNRDAVSHLVVVSDGIANVPLDVPLSPLTRRRYTSDAQADSFDVARLIAKEGFRVYVVNTNHSKEEAKARPLMEEGRRLRYTPTQFLMKLARLTKGNYIGLSPTGEREELRMEPLAR
jgi:Mg-chelatase subunit ChlI/Mg-chelatase subunit ChlD